MTAAEEAAALELGLMDPSVPGVMSRESVLAYDEAEAFPIEAWEALARNGYFDHLVPSDEGVGLHGVDRLLALGRVVARRDPTVAFTATQGLLAALPVLVAGDDAQRAFVSERLRSGERGAFALTEEAHGPDFTRTETRARRDREGYVLDGTKWAIGNATSCAFTTVLARLAAQGTQDEEGLALFLVDSARTAPGERAPTPKLRTHGIRGADVSGARLSACRVPSSARIGRGDDGLSLVQIATQVSRTLSSALALGAADTALRLAIDHVALSTKKGVEIASHPSLRAELRRAFVELLLADALAIFTARALSLMPDQMGLLSAVAKISVTERSLDTIGRAGSVLGPRSYVRAGRYGIFQKLVRDVAVVSLLDGTAAVHRSYVAEHIPRVFGTRLDESARARVLRCAAFSERAPRFEPERLEARGRGMDDVLTGLTDAVAKLSDTASSGTCLRLDALALTLNDLKNELRALGTAEIPADEAHGFAVRYAALVNAAVLVHVHAAAETPLPESDAVLSVGLDTILRDLGVRHAHRDDTEHEARVDALLLTLSREGKLYSHVPFILAESLALTV